MMFIHQISRGIMKFRKNLCNERDRRRCRTSRIFGKIISGFVGRLIIQLMIWRAFNNMKFFILTQPFYSNRYFIQEGHNMDIKKEKDDIWKYRHAKWCSFTCIHIAAQRNNAAFLRSLFDRDKVSKRQQYNKINCIVNKKTIRFLITI